MNEHQPDERIQTDAKPEFPTAPAFLADETVKRRTRTAGMLYGAFAGMPMAALAGGVWCWLLEYEDHAWTVAFFAGLAGIPVGALIGFVERTIRGDLARSDIATFIGGVFGLTIALLMLVGAAGIIGGIWLTVGLLCMGPMMGFLVGAVFDRVYESLQQRTYVSAIFFGILGLAACLGPIHLIVHYSAPDPRLLEREAMRVVLDEWRGDPILKKAKIRKVELTRVEGRSYTGAMVAALDGDVMQFDMDVQYQHGEIRVSWKPRP